MRSCIRMSLHAPISKRADFNAAATNTLIFFPLLINCSESLIYTYASRTYTTYTQRSIYCANVR